MFAEYHADLYVCYLQKLCEHLWVRKATSFKCIGERKNFLPVHSPAPVISTWALSAGFQVLSFAPPLPSREPIRARQGCGIHEDHDGLQPDSDGLHPSTSNGPECFPIDQQSIEQIQQQSPL